MNYYNYNPPYILCLCLQINNQYLINYNQYVDIF